MIAYILAYLCSLTILLGFTSLASLNKENKTRKIISGIFTLISVIILYTLIIVRYKEPKAIDVYRGKTTLEITYRNNVPIDTVVTYKDR